MEFTTKVRNTLTGQDLEFTEPFTILDCFTEDERTKELVCKYLKINNNGMYEDLLDIFEEYAYELEEVIVITDIEEFDCSIKGATISMVNEFYNLGDEYKNKIRATCEAWGVSLEEIVDTSWDDVYLFEDVGNNRDLAEYYVDNFFGGVNNLSKETLESHFDFESYGRDLAFGGSFTKYGFLEDR